VRQKCHMSARPPRPPMASEVRKSSDSESTHGPVRAAVADLSPPRLVGHHATAAAAAAIAGGSWGGDQGIGGGLRFFALFLSPSSRWASRSFSPPVAWCRRHSSLAAPRCAGDRATVCTWRLRFPLRLRFQFVRATEYNAVRSMPCHR
jgi:hypothetical protein